MKKLLTLLLVAFSFAGFAQTRPYIINYDTIKLKSSGTSGTTLVVENATKDSIGFLFNTGKGVTIFKRAVERLDSNRVIIGGDTLTLGSGSGGTGGTGGGDSILYIGLNETQDSSIFLLADGRRFAIPRELNQPQPDSITVYSNEICLWYYGNSYCAFIPKDSTFVDWTLQVDSVNAKPILGIKRSVRDSMLNQLDSLRIIGTTVSGKKNGVWIDQFVVPGGVGGSTDTTSLSARINQKINISDTATMLAGYQTAINSKVRLVSDLAPLFTTANPTTTPTFSLSNAAAHTIFGNHTSSSAPPAHFINPFLDSLKTSADSLYALVNGTWKYQFRSWAFDSSFLKITAIGLGTTQAANKGILLTNPTVTTSGVPNQNSPALVFSSQSYGSTLGTSQTQEWRIQQTPVSSTAPQTTLLFQYSRSGGAFVTQMALNSNNLSTITGSLTASGNITATSTLSGGALSVIGGASFGNVLTSTMGQNNTTSVSGLVTNVFANTGIINNTTGTSTHRGFYYAPTLGTLTGTTVNAFENTVGNNILNRVSGSTVIGGTSVDPSAKFQIDDTNHGTLITRGTKSQRDAMSSPAQGLLYFVTDGTGYMCWYNSGWQKVSSIADP